MKLAIKSIISVFFIINFYGCTPTQLNELYALLIDQQLDIFTRDKVAMLNISIFRDNEEIYQSAIGYSNITNGLLAQVNNTYSSADISSVFTATIIHKLIELKKININTTLDSFYPTIDRAKKITIAHLLRHQSGINILANQGDYDSYKATSISREDLDSKIIANGVGGQVPLQNPNYNITNYIILSRIVEKVTGLNYSNVLKEMILTPCKLESTKLQTDFASQSKEALPHYLNDSSEWQVQSNRTHPSILLGAGAISTSPKDINIFLIKLLNGSILSATSVDLMKQSMKGINSVGISDSDAIEFGYGIFKIGFNGKIGYGHFGKQNDFHSMGIYFPNEKISFTYLANGISNTTTQESVASRLLNIYFNNTSN